MRILFNWVLLILGVTGIIYFPVQVIAFVAVCYLMTKVL